MTAKLSIRKWDTFYKLGDCAWTVLCLTPPGRSARCSLSPLLANLLLDELDQELERRQHRSVQYGDDCNIYVSSCHAGERVLASIKTFLEKRLKLKVNEQKSAVARG